MEDIKSIASKFSLKGEIVEICQFGNGLINKTFKIVTTERRYILQRINSYVFTDVDALMNNIVRVTEHLIEKDVFTLRIIPTYDGKLFYKNEDGYFRVFKLIENTICFEGIENLEIIKKTGYSFGQLHKNLADLDPNPIVDVIPNFHNTVARYKRLLTAISKDPVDRARNVKELLVFLVKYGSYTSLITDALKSGEIPLGITHNDPKINNVLFDKDTLDVKAVIDLDTVMKGSVLFDFGDALRSLFTGDNEDTTDLSLLKVDLDVYRAYLEGYYSQMKGTLKAKEIELLPYSVLILTLELLIRFLTDYVEGDIYFSTKYSEQNYNRAMTQYTLAKNLITNMDKLVEITNEICK